MSVAAVKPPSPVEAAFGCISEAQRALADAEDAVSNLEDEHVYAHVRARRIIERWKYTAPGLTNAELALLERFVSELETA